MLSLRRWLRVLAPLAGLLVLADAWGRAGGGDSYSGGSSSSSGSSGGGDFVIQLVWLLLQLVFEYPKVGVPLLVVTLIGLYIFYNMGNNQYRRGTPLVGERAMTRTIADDRKASAEGHVGSQLEAIKARDPAFDPQQFLGRAGGAFLKIQQAWSAQDMAPARAQISDGVMERFSIQIEMQKTDGVRNDMSGVSIIGSSILRAESDAHFDTVHVSIHASAVDTTVSLADGRRVAGSGQPSTFTEIWSFLRRPGAKTLTRPGLLEGFCPSCGAPLAIADAAQCGSCKTWVNSGEYDWVLCEITQVSEWAVRDSGDAVQGFSAVAQRDPLLNTQFLEDRSSVVFWRWQLALSQGNARPLQPVAAPQFCHDWESDSGARQFRYRDAAVGAVEVRALESGPDLDRAHVSVRWSGAQFEAASGKPLAGRQLREHIFVLARRSGAHTDASTGLSSCRCPNCGAPPSSREVVQCEYCGTPFNDGSRSWVLVEMLPIAAWRRPAPVGAEAPDGVSGGFDTGPVAGDLGWVQGLATTEVLAVLVAGMLSDGVIDPAERKYLDQYASNNHVPPATIDGLIEAARQNHLDIPKPQTPQEANACLNGLIQMCLIDGRVDVAEMKLILAYAESAGIPRSKVVQRVKAIRLEMYRQATART